jgi:hypothetical protein
MEQGFRDDACLELFGEAIEALVAAGRSPVAVGAAGRPAGSNFTGKSRSSD